MIEPRPVAGLEDVFATMRWLAAGLDPIKKELRELEKPGFIRSGRIRSVIRATRLLSERVSTIIGVTIRRKTTWARMGIL